MVIYYAFTTLSTVGFGDFNPKSDAERLVCCVIMVAGVAIFGYVMNNFLDIINQFFEYERELDEGDELSKFFSALKFFNKDADMGVEFKRKYEKYFAYYWNCDKNQAIDEPDEVEIFQ